MKENTSFTGGGGMLRGISAGFPKPPRAVKWLLIINGVSFLVQLALVGNPQVRLISWFGATTKDFWQVWRYVTFQFLHDTGSFWHIGMNMFGLYMFGTALEQLWGSRRFLRFYLSCGMAAGLLFVIAGAILVKDAWVPLIGASGGVFGILLACAVVLPHMKVILVIFPVSIRVAAVIIFGGMILYLLSSLKAGVYSGGFWSQVAHFGGAGMAAMWMWVIPRFRGSAEDAFRKANRGVWDRKMRQKRDEQAKIDRILDKIRSDGLASLTWKEKRTLKEATRRQQREDRDISRL